MRPDLALVLSSDGISLLSRPDGAEGEGWAWWREGSVRLDDPGLDAALARLRDRAVARVGGSTTYVVLPDDQLLFTTIERDDRRPEDTIRASLRGRTPYEVEDLVFDHVLRGDRLQVAVVARETLAEAAAFAEAHDLRPVGFAADPAPDRYREVAWFGAAADAEVARGADRVAPPAGRFVARPAPAPTTPTVFSAPSAADAPTDARALDAAVEPNTAGPVDGSVQGGETKDAPAFASRRRTEGTASPNLVAAPAQPRAKTRLSAVTPVPTPPSVAGGGEPARRAKSEDEATRFAMPGRPREAATASRGRRSILAAALVSAVIAVLLAAAFWLRGDPPVADDGDNEAEASVAIAVAPEPDPAPEPERAPDVDAAALRPPAVPSAPTEEAPAETGRVARLPQPTSQPPATLETVPERATDAGTTDASALASAERTETTAETAAGAVDDGGTTIRVTRRTVPVLAAVDPDATTPSDQGSDPGSPSAETAIPDAEAPSEEPAEGVSPETEAASDASAAAETAPTVAEQRSGAMPNPAEAAATEAAAVPESGAETADAVIVDSSTADASVIRPRPRPAALVVATNVDAGDVETGDGETGGGASDAARIASAEAAGASLVSGAEVDEAVEAALADASPSAVATSRRPATRPAGLSRPQPARRAAAAAPQADPAPAPTARSGQTIRSAGGNVAQAATDRNVVRLNRINLVGTYGTASARRALVRLSNGRYVKVEVGDRLDRGRVVAIGESELRYQKGGRNIVLRMPRA